MAAAEKRHGLKKRKTTWFGQNIVRTTGYGSMVAVEQNVLDTKVVQDQFQTEKTDGHNFLIPAEPESLDINPRK